MLSIFYFISNYYYIKPSKKLLKWRDKAYRHIDRRITKRDGEKFGNYKMALTNSLQRIQNYLPKPLPSKYQKCARKLKRLYEKYNSEKVLIWEKEYNIRLDKYLNELEDILRRGDVPKKSYQRHISKIRKVFKNAGNNYIPFMQ